MDLVRFVLSNAVAVAPWFFLSIGLGVMVRSLRLAEGLGSILTRRPVPAIVGAALLGAVAPFCSCTVVPVVAGLLVAGVPLAPVMAFWVASPTMDPEIFTFTVAVLGWPLAVARLGAAVLLSLAAGFGAHLLLRRFGNPLRHSGSAGCDTEEGSCEVAAHPRVQDPSPATVAVDDPPRVSLRQRLQAIEPSRLAAEMAGESWQLGRWLLAAFALEWMILAWVPQAQIVALLGGSNPFSLPIAALVGVPMYVSNLTAVPVVAGLLDQGMGSGAALAFLLAGPVTTVPAMLAVRPLVRTPVFVYYLGVGVVGAMLLGGLGGLVLGG